jgi:dihydrofolate reductase
MGRVIYSMSVSLDGFVETPDHSLDWILIDEELHRLFNQEAREVGAFLYGRRMYELMAGYWPAAPEDPAASPAMLEFAAIWAPMPKVVFSRTLERVEFGSRLVAGDAVEAVTRLRAEPGADMGVGGPTLAATLIRADLIDEFRLAVQPVILGAGTPYFPPADEPMNLKLLETQTLASGVIRLRYAR